jgi:hypothetical protein
MDGKATTSFDHCAVESTTVPCQLLPTSQRGTLKRACFCCHCALDACCVACRQLIGSDSRKVGSWAGMKTIKAKLQTRKPGGGLLGAELAELAKAATAKDVPKPDAELNEMVGSLLANLNWAYNAACRRCLIAQLSQTDPHLLALCRWWKPSTPTASLRLSRQVVLHIV